MRTNRGRTSKGTDHWITRRALIEALGPFDLDPCCPPVMPWRTAARMIAIDEPPAGPAAAGAVACEPGDGLLVNWRGRVFVNPPYSRILPWIVKMGLHGDGFVYVPSKSSETAWGQALLGSADALLFERGRRPFCALDGTAAGGCWHPMVLAAYGRECVEILEGVARIQSGPCPGIVLVRKAG